MTRRKAIEGIIDGLNIAVSVVRASCLVYIFKLLYYLWILTVDTHTLINNSDINNQIVTCLMECWGSLWRRVLVVFLLEIELFDVGLCFVRKHRGKFDVAIIIRMLESKLRQL